MFTVEAIGYFHSNSKSPYDLPRQPETRFNHEGVIQLNPGCQFEQALEGLEGFDRIWVLFYFHCHHHWKPKVLPPRGGKKQGVFATRSPHRPNFIGLSCVQLRAIKGLKLFIIHHDLLDGTPILDLKPYLNYVDSISSARQGWLDTLTQIPFFTIEWSSLAQLQMDYLAQTWNCHLKTVIENRLLQSPFPYPNNRIRQLKTNEYELAYQTWRIYYQHSEDVLYIHYLSSGYDLDTLQGKKFSKWNDVPIHQAFMHQFKGE